MHDSITFSFVNDSIYSGCWLIAIKLPREMRPIVTPSRLHQNSSPRISGDNIAVKIIVNADVYDISITFPNFKTTIIEIKN